MILLALIPWLMCFGGLAVLGLGASVTDQQTPIMQAHAIDVDDCSPNACLADAGQLIACLLRPGSDPNALSDAVLGKRVSWHGAVSRKYQSFENGTKHNIDIDVNGIRVLAWFRDVPDARTLDLPVDASVVVTGILAEIRARGGRQSTVILEDAQIIP